MENLESDVNEIISTESLLDNLCDLCMRIHGTEGMTKSFALEAVDLQPEIFQDTPMAYFTKEPSATQFHASLESIGGAIWEAIKKVAKAISEFFKKFISWLFPGKNKPVEIAGLLESSARNSRELNNQLLQYEDMIKRVGNMTWSTNDEEYVEFSESPRRVSNEDSSNFDFSLAGGISINEILSKYAKANPESPLGTMLLSKNGLYSDILHDGPYSKMMRGYKTSLGSLHECFTECDNITKEIIAELKKAHQTAYASNPDFISKMQAASDKAAYKMRSPVSGQEQPIAEVVDAVEKVRATAVANKNNKEIQFTELNILYERAVNSTSIIEMLNIIDKYERIFAILDNAFEEIAKMLDHPQNYRGDIRILAELSHAINNALRAIRVNTVAALRLVGQVKNYANLMLQVDSQIIRVQKMGIDMIDSKLKQMGVKFSPKDEGLSKGLNDNLKKSLSLI